MWKLKNIKREHIEHYIFIDEICIVGRKDANLLIADDPSISRRHAVLQVQHPEINMMDPSRKSSLFLQDENSKYGTFVNGKKITSKFQLQENDIVKFGQFQSEFRVQHIPFVVTTSCLDVASKNCLKKALLELGGHLLPEWHPTCTHLAMSEIKVTIKTLCCLVSAKPVVKPEYFQHLKESLKASQTMIPHSQFLPPIGEPLIDKDAVSFDIDFRRKKVFDNKTFFFLDEKQYKKLHLGITLGGGNASLLVSGNINAQLLIQDDSCVIDPGNDSRSSQEIYSLYMEVSNIFQRNRLRMIPESDIGLSVVHCSTEKFCNPSFNMGTAVLQSGKIQSQTLNEREVYVPDTEGSARSSEPNRNFPPNSMGSFNFSSFRNSEPGGMEISQTPLSNKVKTELNNMFGDLDDNDNDSAGKSSYPKPSMSSSESSGGAGPSNEEDGPSSKRPRMDVKQENGVENYYPPLPTRQNGVVKQEEESPDKKPEIKTENHFDDSNFSLPSNLIKIEFADLIYRQPTIDNLQYMNTGAKNFKKFKKVYPRRSGLLPNIIGSYQLIEFDKVLSDAIHEPWQDNSDEASQPMRGKFDWDTPAM